MNTIKSYKALAIVSNADQGELIKRLIKENKSFKRKEKEREEFYSTKKDNLLRMFEYHEEMKHCSDYTSDEDDEDGDNYRTHFEFLQIITSILTEEYKLNN